MKMPDCASLITTNAAATDERCTLRVTPDSSATVLETRLRVRYAETDQMSVVYHSNYIIWFEVGRVEFMRQLGISYKEMEQTEQMHLPVAEVRCRFKASARYDDEIVIRTHIARLRSYLIQFRYQVMRAEDGLLLAEGESTHVSVNAQMATTPFPEKYMSVFRRVAGRTSEAQTEAE
jgi:acyl-CoA thioester hydrolase